ncbi:hypothetical protein HZH66_007343 [Vespula vulgaris]|uniref:Uncharacterized protein n=1 Tax=Vespula vulgaris TaxID=7454 RepID=A0A834K3A7_VESVU|nr:hypothetical protein HZH66_007343 [Vespula vulgaris]
MKETHSLTPLTERMARRKLFTIGSEGRDGLFTTTGSSTKAKLVLSKEPEDWPRRVIGWKEKVSPLCRVVEIQSCRNEKAREEDREKDRERRGGSSIKAMEKLQDPTLRQTLHTYLRDYNKRRATEIITILYYM